MSGGGKASLDAMGDMIRTLSKVEQLLESVDRDLRQKYDSIGSSWNDEQYKKMGDEIDEVSRHINDCSAALSEGTTKLQIRMRMLEQYLSLH